MAEPLIVALVVDRLQQGWLGAYGNTWVATPAFNYLSAVGFTFDQALAASPELGDIYAGLLGELAAQGASLLTDDPRVAQLPSFAGWPATVLPAPKSATAASAEDSHFAACFSAAINHLQDARRGGLHWLHLQGLAAPWDAPYEYRRRFAEEEDPDPPRLVVPPDYVCGRDADPDELLGVRQAYAGQLALLDECLTEFLAWWEEGPQLEGGTLLVLGARGWPLGEHGVVGPTGAGLSAPLLQTPAWLLAPCAALRGARTPALISSPDLGRLLAELAAGADCSQGMLADLHDPRWPGRSAVVVRTPQAAALRTPAWHLVKACDARPELYAKPGDRWEVNNVADRMPEVAALLEELLALPELPAELPPAALCEVD